LIVIEIRSKERERDIKLIANVNKSQWTTVEKCKKGRFKAITEKKTRIRNTSRDSFCQLRKKIKKKKKRIKSNFFQKIVSCLI
jgi:vacuolar-type H+-ATPase subunit H